MWPVLGLQFAQGANGAMLSCRDTAVARTPLGRVNSLCGQLGPGLDPLRITLGRKRPKNQEWGGSVLSKLYLTFSQAHLGLLRFPLEPERRGQVQSRRPIDYPQIQSVDSPNRASHDVFNLFYFFFEREKECM